MGMAEANWARDGSAQERSRPLLGADRAPHDPLKAGAYLNTETGVREMPG